MMQATVTPRYVNAPREGKKNGSITFDHDGGSVRVSVPADQLGKFQPGQSIGISWSPQEFTTPDGQVKSWNKLLSVNTPQGMPAQQSAAPQRQQAHTPDSKSKEMAVMGIVGRAMGSGKYEPADVHHLMMEARVAWESVMEGKAPASVKVVSPPVNPAPQADAGLDDDLPF